MAKGTLTQDNTPTQDESRIDFADDSLMGNNAIAQEYLLQMQTPIILKDGDMAPINRRAQECRVGDLSFTDTNTLSTIHREAVITKPNFAQPKDAIDHSKLRVIRPGDKDFSNEQIAYHDDKKGTVTLQDFQGNVNAINSTMSQHTEYIKGNPVAQLSVLYHEFTHLKHFQYDGYDMLDKPADMLRGYRLTEKIACANQYHFAAHLYTILKENKIAQIEVNGEKKPIESILEMYDGLKEYVTQNGYSPNNKKDVRAVTQIASDWWNRDRGNSYLSRHLFYAVTQSPSSNMFDAIESEQEKYDKVSKAMMKNLYIGNNTNIDLSDCRDILDDMSKDDALTRLENMSWNGASGITFGKASEISAYLESQGITEQQAKIDYLRKNFDHIVLRDGECDEKLKEILLNTNSKNSGTIIYADGLTEKRDAAGNHTITGSKGTADIAKYEADTAELKAQATKDSNNAFAVIDGIEQYAADARGNTNTADTRSVESPEISPQQPSAAPTRAFNPLIMSPRGNTR